jgi:CheY-like chemotaxis protein
MLAIFIDDDVLPGIVLESHDLRFVGPLPEAGSDSLDDWFERRLLVELQTIEENADLIYVIHANLKLLPKSLRCFHVGMQVLEHIRFTRSLPDKVRFAPAVLYSFEPSWRLAARAEHPLLLAGAGLAFARLPEHLPSLVDPSYWPRWGKAAGTLDAGRMRGLLNPAVALGGSVLYAHSYRNLAGAGKFCQEFAGDILGPQNDVVGRLRREEDRDRRLKRLLAALPELSSGDPPKPEERTEFLRICKDVRFLEVDDEHDKGWSLGLYAGISGSPLSPDDYDSICRDARENGSGRSSEGRMHVVSRAEDAETLLARTHEQFEERLVKWADAFDAWDRAEPQLSSAKATRERVDRSYQQSVRFCTAARDAARDRRDKAEGELRESTRVLDKIIRDAGEKIASSILDALPGPRASDQELLQVGKLLPKLTEAIDLCNQAQSRREQAVEAMSAQEAALKEVWNEKAISEEALQKAEGARSRARSISIECRHALEGALPFEMVFLDLRLRPSEDARLPAAKASGMRILQQVHLVFPAIPVVVMTASEKALSLEQAMANGASGYWIKGVSTGAQMRDIVRRAALRAKLAPLWTKLQQVRKRGYLNGKQLNPAGTEFQPCRITSTEDRQIVDTLLEASFFRVWNHADSTSGAATDINRVIVDLGIIHEIRYKGAKPFLAKAQEDERMSFWDNAKGVEGQDNALRKLRNSAVHALNRAAATQADARMFLEHTLNQLLQDPG